MSNMLRPVPLWKKIVGGAFYLAVCLMCLAAGTVAGWVTDSPLLTEAIVQAATNKPPQETFAQSEVTLLLLGCDEDLYYGGYKSTGGPQVLKKQARSDLMMVAKLDFGNNRISGLSIPRDTLVSIPGYREQKINAYHSMGHTPEEGKDLARRAVEKLLPVSIDRVVVLDYEAFKELVDMVGGVEVFVPKKMKYTDEAGGLFIDFEPGRHKMSGYDAMCFIRFRKGSGGDNDFERQKRQKDFLLAFKDAVRDHKSMLPQIAEKGKAVLGGALSDPEIVSLALFAGKIGADNIKLGQIPVVDADNYNLRVDEGRLQEALREHYLASNGAVRVSRR